MNRTEGRNLRVVLYEGTGSYPLGDEERFETLSILLDNGFEVTRPVSGQEVAPADDAPILVLGRLDQQPPVAATMTFTFATWASATHWKPRARSARRQGLGSSKHGNLGSR